MSYSFEEQEQLAQLRHFWSRWGTLISIVVVALAVASAGFYGWRWWQRDEGAKAAAVFEQVQAAIESNNPDKIAQAWATMQERAPHSDYAGMAALTVAKALHQAGKTEPAEQALQWAIDQADSQSVRAVARLSLADMQIDAKQYDKAKATLSVVPEDSFKALFSWRLGDIAALQGQRDAARSDYQAALNALPKDAPERSDLIQRLNAVGGEAQ